MIAFFEDEPGADKVALILKSLRNRKAKERGRNNFFTRSVALLRNALIEALPHINTATYDADCIPQAEPWNEENKKRNLKRSLFLFSKTQ